MREGTAPLIRREDYTAPAWWIRTVDLTLDLDPAKTLVTNRMQIERNTAIATSFCSSCVTRPETLRAPLSDVTLNWQPSSAR